MFSVTDKPTVKSNGTRCLNEAYMLLIGCYRKDGIHFLRWRPGTFLLSLASQFNASDVHVALREERTTKLWPRQVDCSDRDGVEAGVDYPADLWAHTISSDIRNIPVPYSMCYGHAGRHWVVLFDKNSKYDQSVNIHFGAYDQKKPGWNHDHRFCWTDLSVFLVSWQIHKGLMFLAACPRMST